MKDGRVSTLWPAVVLAAFALGFGYSSGGAQQQGTQTGDANAVADTVGGAPNGRGGVGPAEDAQTTEAEEPGESGQAAESAEVAEAREAGFRGGDDDALLASLCNATPVRWERNPRGTTISFRVYFADGSQAIYKPDQRIAHSNWESEVAAYRLSRRLGIHRVPPSCPRRASRDELLGAEGMSRYFRRRVLELVLFDAEGTVPGMAMHWVADLRAREAYTRSGEWRAWLVQGGRIPEDRLDDAAALSDMLLLDWLVSNTDRWSGDNVRRAGDANGPLVFIDNAAGFGSVRGERRVWVHFRRVQRFSRETVERLRGLDDAALDELLSDLLSVVQIGRLRSRRDRALEHIGKLVELYGEANVLFFR